MQQIEIWEGQNNFFVVISATWVLCLESFENKLF